MIKYGILVLALAVYIISPPAFAASDKEKAAAVLTQTTALLKQYSSLHDPALLQKLDREIENTWAQFTYYYGTKHLLSDDLALLRARSASAAKRGKVVADHWRQAIKLLPYKTAGSRRLGLYAEAANASTAVEDFRAAEQFFAAARSLASVRGENADKAALYLRLHELKTTGQAMEWRQLNDNLLDMRKYSEAFVMWSIPRLDALLAEAEIRLEMQPNDNDKKKRIILGDLKAQIELAQKGMNGSLPPMHKARIRALFYALEDNFQL